MGGTHQIRNKIGPNVVAAMPALRLSFALPCASNCSDSGSINKATASEPMRSSSVTSSKTTPKPGGKLLKAIALQSRRLWASWLLNGIFTPRGYDDMAQRATGTALGRL